MKGAARPFFILAVCYAVAGMVLGIAMAAMHDHTQMPTHAHIMVAGFLMSSVFAFFYHLFPEIGSRPMARIHFYVQAISGVVLVASLFVLLQGTEQIEPVTALASIGFLAGMLLFIWNARPVLRAA
ncbi:NnrS family protein [Aestuariivirga sp.]|uniref:NnrS family protein n=1 Tax=Aestuariivirga sp. TaxID=2650926 RepID=UPI003BAC4589